MGARPPGVAGRRRPAGPRSTSRRAALDRLPALSPASGRTRPGPADPPDRRGDPPGPARCPLALARPGAADPRIAPARPDVDLQLRLAPELRLAPHEPEPVAGPGPRPGAAHHAR